MNGKRKIMIFVVCLFGVIAIGICMKEGKITNKNNESNIGVENSEAFSNIENDIRGVEISEAFSNIENDIRDVKSGTFQNMKVVELNPSLDGMDELYQIDIYPDKTYSEDSYTKSINKVQAVVDEFYGKSVDLSQATLYLMDDGAVAKDEVKEYSFQEFCGNVEAEKYNGNGYFLIFQDNREKGEKGFVQIDSSLVSTWMSKGELSETNPLYGYDTKKVYNFTISNTGIDDVVKLRDGEIKIADAKKYIEKYLNDELPYEKNDEFVYEVAEIRVLDADGENALGFCVRKKYNNVPFDYIDGTTEGIYNSDFWDDRGELSMVYTDEVDNTCGLGGDTFSVKKSKEKLKKICTLKEAFGNVSKAIGENSIYDVYGAELIYQFTPLLDKQNKDMVVYYSGRLQWKIIARNENDDKDTWFYVDVENGKVTHRFKKIYGE